MTYVRNDTLIGGLRDYEKAMRDLHDQLEKRTESEATREVSDYFESVHDFVKDVLDRREKDMDEASAKTFNQYTPDTHPLEELDHHLPVPEDARELIPWTLARQNHVADWCDTMSKKSISPRTNELFGDIADQIRELTRQLAYDTKAYEQDGLHS